ncbi:MAG TPA: 3'(2'),5'-bisphosphate nucleotidase CysQ [Terriglobales bacterium]
MNLLQAVIECAAEAGNLIEDAGRQGFKVAVKSGSDPITDADRLSDDFLREALPRLEAAGWLSEETSDDTSRLHRELVWVVDPLDGTKEFIERIPQYSVAIALIQDGYPILGVIHNPATKATFSAERGMGAWHDGKRLWVAEGSVLLASRTEMKAGEFAPFSAWRVESMGSIALKLAQVAAGRAGVTLSRGPKWEWDVCAGALLVSEAGGTVLDIWGSELRFNKKFPKVKGIIAGAPTSAEHARATAFAAGALNRMNELTDRAE